MTSLDPLMNTQNKSNNRYGTVDMDFSNLYSAPDVTETESDIFSINKNNGDRNLLASPKRERIIINGNIRNTKLSFWDVAPYYMPCFVWIRTYSWSMFFGDLLAGISLASFQIPLALSYATSLAHVEPLCGLYSLAITPFIYAIFGSVPHMIVGPESALSLVMGQTIEKIMSHNEELKSVDLAAIVTFVAGITLLVAGICRIGFLGSVLSRALLRGFISSVGFVMVINSLISELKLNKVMLESPGHHHTAFEKAIFLIKYGPENYHKATAIVSVSCFTILMAIRFAKRKLSKKFKWIVIFPEILLVVVLTIYLSVKFSFKKKYGIAVLGDFNSGSFEGLVNPVSKRNRSTFSIIYEVGIVIALLGFFESTTASKSLGGIDNSTVSSNRELIAMGIMNVGASVFGALPAFGGYGRSKINAMSGAKSVVSGVFMGLITLFTIRFLLPTIRYTPICVLSVITTIVGISLLEEAPNDIKFHIACRGYNELVIFTLTFLTTIFYSVDVGISIGFIYSLLYIVKRSAKSRIQILAKVEGIDHFVNADEYHTYHHSANSSEVLNLEHFKDCLIVKIPEPLTFSNTEDLKERLDRLERFGSVNTHPGSRDIRSRGTVKFVIFDLKGMTFIDSSAVQILKEIITDYNERNVQVLLSRVPFNNEVRFKLQKSGISDLIMKYRIPNNIDMMTNSTTTSAQLGTMILDAPYFANVEEAMFAIECAVNANFP
ncbi:similar to Saccharomyces cerevisiae YPR003C Putative sulfate permease [Maudiozyma saulgeensis]|uniref:Similar to Saccharomyces cerevisiae YPR003C Putative sulfate permease n=1 Tax=Maudiozyma saulgeensis TaxID=1789683 RepID=A0A1X7R064_9SACH|nr:similar to Saccharomyces cerevisiae YPR003C Putative sulfate permease [Kazachstania saulgeensis]